MGWVEGRMEDVGEGMKDEVRGGVGVGVGVGESKDAKGDRKPDRMLRDSIQVAGGGPGWQVAG